MFTTMRQWSFAGLALSSCALNTFAAETAVYRFRDGTVTITPGRSRSVASSPNQAGSVSSASTSVNASHSTTDGSRILIRPVSLRQDDSTKTDAAAPQPAPNPEGPDGKDEVVPQLKTTSEPNPAPAPTPAPAGVPATQIQVAPASPRYAIPYDGFDLPVITPRSPESEPRTTVVPAQTSMYRDIYFSIPFSRTEYNANPSYRHDATMEFLFNQMRPTVINRGTTTSYNYHYDMNYGNGYGYPGYYYPSRWGIRVLTR